LSRNPQRFQVGHRPAAAQVAEMFAPAEHFGDLRNRFLFHRRSRAPAVERMIVGIDPLRQRISQTGHRMRRFQHLPGIERMKIRIVVLQALGGGREGFCNGFRA